MTLLIFCMVLIISYLFYFCLSEYEAKCCNRVFGIGNANQSGIFLGLVQKATANYCVKVCGTINLNSDDYDDDDDYNDNNNVIIYFYHNYKPGFVMLVLHVKYPIEFPQNVKSESLNVNQIKINFDMKISIQKNFPLLNLYLHIYIQGE